MASEYESAQTSARVKRAAAASARDGRPAGGRAPYGYRRTYDERTGRLTGQEIVPDEAANVRAMFEMFCAGESLRAIATAMRERGVHGPGRTVKGEHVPGSPATIGFVRQVLINPAYYGARVHQGKVAVEDAWPAIVPKQVFLRAKRVFYARATGPTHRPGRAVHLCSALAPHIVCGVCGAALAPQRIKGKLRYRCKGLDGVTGHITIACDDLDPYVTAVVLEHLARPDQVGDLLEDGGHDEDLEAARTAVAEITGEHQDLMNRVARGELSPAFAAGTEPGILERLQKAERRVDELATPSRLRDFIKPGAEVAQSWEDASVAAKRDLLRFLLTPDKLGHLRVQRRPDYYRGSRRCPITERVEWRRVPQ